MGGAKNEMLEAWDRGWSSSDARICTSCVVEPALRKAVEQESNTQAPCTYCTNSSSAPFDALLAAFKSGLDFLYDDALNSVSYDSSEGGFVGAATWDTYDLLQDFYEEFADETSSQIIEELRSCLEAKDWVYREDPDFSPKALLEDAWQNFATAIKHDTRFVFWLAEHEPEEYQRYSPYIGPAEALDHVGAMIEELDLFHCYPERTQLYRARTFRGEQEPQTARELGTPPCSASIQGNRMSPAGIPMFYAGETAEVALDEVSVRTEDRDAALGTFESTKSVYVIDLTRRIEIPSPFDPNLRHLIWKIEFLRDFVDKISEPIGDGRDQVDYLPTQVMTEYLLRVHKWQNDTRGIRYPSAAKEGGVCVVLSISHEDCIDSGSADKDDSVLQMELSSNKRYAAALNWTSVSP